MIQDGGDFCICCIIPLIQKAIAPPIAFFSMQKKLFTFNDLKPHSSYEK